MTATHEASQAPLPVILIRGYGGVSTADEQRDAYQGFNTGTVYPHRRGENYIYEGLVIKFLKAPVPYLDATNLIRYDSQPVRGSGPVSAPLQTLDPGYFAQNRIVIDPAVAGEWLAQGRELRRTLWVFRYYDLQERHFSVYGEALARLIDCIHALQRAATGAAGRVNIIAHSMGGLIVREALQCVYPRLKGRLAAEEINKIVTLGTPHRGVPALAFADWLGLEPGDELEHFSPRFQADPANPASYARLAEAFPPERILTVIGTQYRTFTIRAAALANRLLSLPGEGGPAYNRSDGLVKQACAELPGAPRTFVHKCHSGADSLVTARETYEIATRFFFGTHRVRLWLREARIWPREDGGGQDRNERSEYFFGVSIKPRGVDFELFHQSKEAENCYGPFHREDLSDTPESFGWAGPGRLIWEGWLDTARSRTGQDLALRLRLYVSERDAFGFGFSDDVIYYKQVLVRATPAAQGGLSLRAGEDPLARQADGSWSLTLGDDGFSATLGLELEALSAPEAAAARAPATTHNDERILLPES